MPKADAPTEGWVALLGRGQEGADGILDYCRYLGEALGRRGVALEISRVDWARLGWVDALKRLRRESREWRGRWVLLQYTALAFSSRGFPLRALRVVGILRQNGVRLAVVFHDPFHQGGRRVRDRLRGRIQDWVIRRIFSEAEIGVFPDPLSKISWIPKETTKAVSIPIGANIPELASTTSSHPDGGDTRTAAVFCLSLDDVVSEELGDLAIAARTACDAGAQFRLVFLGRGTEEPRGAIYRAFRGIPLDISILGILKPEELAEELRNSDAMLCVRGMLYPRRGSAIAGIACGLPILGYAGLAEGTPMAEAGVLLAPYRDASALGRSLARVLRERSLEFELRNRSAEAFRKHFSWDVIAAAFLRALGDSRR